MTHFPWSSGEYNLVENIYLKREIPGNEDAVNITHISRDGEIR